MQTVLSKEVTGYGGYNRYVNKKGHPTNIQLIVGKIGVIKIIVSY